MRFSAYLSVLATSMCLATASDTLGHTTNNSAALAETFSAADIHASMKDGTKGKASASTSTPSASPSASKTTAANQVASKGDGASAGIA